MAYYPFAPEIEARYVLTNAANGAVSVFNDSLDPVYAGMLSEVTGLDSPDVRESAEELAQADGGTHGYFYFGRRPMTLSGRVYGHATVAERNLRLDRINRSSLALRGDSILSWKPSTRNENLVTNPRGQSNTTDWSTTAANSGIQSGATLTRVTAVAPAVGTTALQVATTGTGNSFQGGVIPITLVSGQTYSVSFSARRTVGTASGELFITDNTNITSLTTSLTGAAFATFTATFTAAASGTWYVGVRQGNSNTSAATFQISDVMVRPGSTTTYVDGDTAGYYWQGDVGNSASGNFIEMFTTVRRQGPLRVSGGWIKDFQIPLVSEFAAMYSVGLKTLSATAGTGIVVENRGSWPASPILRITGPSSAINPTITQSAGGTAVITTTGSLLVASGEILEIDTLNHTATFTAGARSGQSGNSFINFSTTTWPTIPTGNCTFTLSGTTGSLAVVWRDTWV